MTRKSLIAACSLVMLGNLCIGQVNEPCGTTHIINQGLANNPSAAIAYRQYEENLQKRVAEIATNQKNSAQKSTANITIPLVFHVILTQAEIDQIGGTSGIYDRITTQIEVINTDFNALNTDTVPTVFKPLKGNAGFSFGLAHRKPDGTGTPGIEIKIATAGFGGFEVGNSAAKATILGGLDPWDNSKYLNVWICNITNGSMPGEVLGYAYSPFTANNIYQNGNLMGVVLDYLAFGKKTSVTQYFQSGSERGRTMVHELGHYFTLKHIWGDTPVGSGSCSDDDGVGDTPQQKDANQSVCPTFPKANCVNSTGGEMFMDFMDYVPDICMRMFSQGQVSRMQSEFASGGGSATLQWNGLLMTWPTGVEAVSKLNSFDIVPNPSTGLFNISFIESGAPKNIIITNAVGQIVKRIDNISGSSLSVDLSGFNAGIYALQCNFEEGSVTRKVVLQ